MEADIDLDEHVERALLGRHRLRPRARHLGVVDDDREPCVGEERDDPVGTSGMDRVGQPDVGNPGGGHDLGLAEFGATDAHGAGLELPTCDRRTLVRLGVRT
jgi:hypothetical protein